ncbi:MAG: phosphoenolpyruvate mutase [Kordiimonadaceae bacterium]|nr:phosphoenolpyruvate mutase [Kordiimonadaceae bacterium]MBO6567435.1 phosphoenolpyruvate mutase [Kordiimonadaceae bacterium]MBO6963351.1 phosphoenolpyruvate mutase [Kordiimonadaceae bacterium]
MLENNALGFIMEAHNALSAKLATDAGFEALWASSLTLSASMGLRDANELSWSQVLDLVDPMLEFVETPVLVDADSGYGDFNIFGRFVRKASERGVAGVCIEDKAFPKRNSFANTSHELADIDDFCGMIRAAKDQQNSDEFCVVARTEAFVAGAGLSEALERASNYEVAGADALFVHSKQKTAFEIESFCRSWNGNIPLVIAPTTYASTPTADFVRLGIAAVIWANHGLRAAIKAMQDSYQQIAAERSVAGLEGNITSVSELLDITGTEDLIKKQDAYRPPIKKSGS